MTDQQWFLASGELVLDRSNSHMEEAVRVFLPEVLSRIKAKNREFLAEIVNLGRIIGTTVFVKVTDDDEIVWAQRKGRSGLTKFVKNRDPEPCSNVAVVLKKGSSDKHYLIVTSFIGNRLGREPWDDNATDQDHELWRSHALTWGSKQVVEGTETTERPW